MYDFITLFLFVYERILLNASDSVMAGSKFKSFLERMLAGTVDLANASKESNPMDFSMDLASSEDGPTGENDQNTPWLVS